MTQVDFYLIQQPAQEDRMVFACRLCEKAMGQGMKIYIHTNSEKTAQDMDDLLWSFKPESFIPHVIVGLDEDLDADEEIPVFIGFGTSCTVSATLLINLSEEIPEFHDQFDRIAEIVLNQEAAKSKLREHWNIYKAKGFDLKHHPL